MRRCCHRLYAQLAAPLFAAAVLPLPPPVAGLFLAPMASLAAQPDDEMVDDDIVDEDWAGVDVELQPSPQAQAEEIERELRLHVRAELEFVRMACEPTGAQISDLNHAGERFVAKKVAAIRSAPDHHIEPRDRFADRASGFQRDLERVIRDALDTVQRAKYDDALSRTDELVRRAHILDRVATLDKAFLLTAEQRDALGLVLDARWPRPKRSEIDARHRVNPSTDMNARFVQQSIPLPDLPNAFLKAILRSGQYEASPESRTSQRSAEPIVVFPAFDDEGDDQVDDAIGKDDLREELDEPLGLEQLSDVETFSPDEGAVLLEALLSHTLDDIDTAAELDESLRRKLALAGKIDIRQYVRRLTRLERRMVDAQQNQDHGFAAAPDELKLLQAPTSAITDDSSAFRKLLARTLSARQARKVAAVERQRREFAADAARRFAIAVLSERVRLTPAQWTGLLNLLEEHCEPRDSPSLVAEEIRVRVPRELLERALGEAQWELLQPMFGLRPQVAR
ncbi:MAG TPA: hypothetical protein VND64_05180 [Pirellulales bacterium]|nr:hypothetical protein [Pirellulales bacterium]